MLHESSYLGGRLKFITEFSMVTWSKLNIPFDSLLDNDCKNISKSLLFGSASPSISDSSSWMVFPSHDKGSLLFHLHAFGRTKVNTPCKSFPTSSIPGINQLFVSRTIEPKRSEITWLYQGPINVYRTLIEPIWTRSYADITVTLKSNFNFIILCWTFWPAFKSFRP